MGSASKEYDIDPDFSVVLQESVSVINLFIDKI